MCKIVNLYTPSYLRDKLPPRSNPFAQAPHTFKEFRIRTERNTLETHSFRTPSNSGTLLYLTLPKCLNSRSLNHIYYLSIILTKRSFLGFMILKVLWLFQLRLGLSPLRHHKKRHNFLDTPTDICMCKTGVESTEHFLLKCPVYNLKRIVLAENVIPLLTSNNLAFSQNDVNLYLYGHKDLADNDN